MEKVWCDHLTSPKLSTETGELQGVKTAGRNVGILSEQKKAVDLMSTAV